MKDQFDNERTKYSSMHLNWMWWSTWWTKRYMIIILILMTNEESKSNQIQDSKLHWCAGSLHHKNSCLNIGAVYPKIISYKHAIVHMCNKVESKCNVCLIRCCWWRLLIDALISSWESINNYKCICTNKPETRNEKMLE